MFYEILLCTFLEYYSIMIHSKFHSILPKNGQENGTEMFMNVGKKIRENAFEVLLYLIIYISTMQVSHKRWVFYINGFIMETCHIILCMESLIIYLHRNVNNSKFLKKYYPLKFDQHPPPLKDDHLNMPAGRLWTWKCPENEKEEDRG